MLHEEYPAKQEPRDASTPGAVADYEGVDVSNPNPPYASGGAIQPVPLPKKTGGRTVIVGVIAAAAGLAVGGIGGSLAAGSGTAGPTASVTVTARPTATQTIYKTAGQPTEAPTDQPTDTGSYTPHKSDWQIGIKILTNKCFDTAGASITYRIKPEFVGTVAPPADGTVEVSYRVSGGEGGPSDNTFTVTGGQMSYDKEEDVDTPSCSTKLKVKVTDVSYDG